MKTCPECHAGIELDDDLVGSRVAVMPGRLHQYAAPDAMDAVMLFPGVGPILLRAFGDFEIADRAEPAEVPERLSNFLDRLRRDVGRTEEGADEDRPGRIDGKIVAIRVLGERFLDGDTLIEAL